MLTDLLPLRQAFGPGSGPPTTGAGGDDDAGLLLRTALGAILEGGASSERLEGVTSAIKGLMGTVVTVAGAVGDMVDEWQDEVLGVLEQAPMVGVAFTLIKKLVGRGKMATVRFSS